MPETTMKKLRPLWREAIGAFLSDPNYVVEIAKAGAARIARTSPSLPQPR